MPTEEKTDIEDILERTKAEEPKRGKLKIFFGAMAGVGKTYTMLEAARARKKEGGDVVVGYAEAHGRAETEALLTGLEILPRKNIRYKNIDIKEFDIDGALQRRPSLVLVDELAHTNAPGSRHPKRYLDVDELLDAGIDVYTTLNVQHCESANDVVAQITGVAVRETVPDTFIEKADEVELVDLPPEDLLKRLQEGKVYLGDQAERAVENFFQIGNLIALRQLALQYTSRSVDAKMRSYKKANLVSQVWNVRDRFLICISSNPAAINLVRAGKRIAAGMGVEWVVVYVENPSRILTKKERAWVAEMMRLAEKLGGEAVTLNGYDIAATLITYARSRNITKIIVGKPSRPNWHEFLFGSVINDLARKCGEIDLYLIGSEVRETERQPDPMPSKPFPWRSLAWVAVMVVACTAIGWPLSAYLGAQNIAMFYLLGVTIVAYRYGLRAALIAAFVSVLAFDYFFVQPFYTFEVGDLKKDLMTFGIMLAVSFAISYLTNRLRQQVLTTVVQENRARALYYLNRDLARTADRHEIIRLAMSHMTKFFKCPVIIFTPDALRTLVAHDENFSLTANERAVAEWAYQHERRAGKDTETLPGSRGMYLPLAGAEKVVGVVGAFPGERGTLADPDNVRIFEMFAQQTALAIEGVQLAVAAIKAESAVENERLRNMLLSTFSFELPTPLKAISEAASELLKNENAHDDGKRDALIRKIRTEAERLNSLSAEMSKIIRSEDSDR